MRPEHMDDWTTEEVLQVAWKNVTPELKQRMLERLWELDTSRLQDIWDQREDIFFHHSTGMGLRNYLRKAIPDADLPPFDEYYGEGTDIRNWDDYYMNALKLAKGLRD